jgi:hypothetical protein
VSGSNTRALHLIPGIQLVRSFPLLARCKDSWGVQALIGERYRQKKAEATAAAAAAAAASGTVAAAAAGTVEPGAVGGEQLRA